MTDPAAIITGGTIDIDFEFHRADESGRRLQNITEYIYEGRVDADVTSGGSMMTFQASCTEKDLLTPFRDWLVPIIVLRYPDPNDGNSTITDRRQLGFFNVMPSPRYTWTQYGSVVEVDGRDALYRLTSSGPGVPYNIPAGTNIAAKMQSICSNLSINAIIEKSSRTTGGKRAFTSDMKWIDIVNALGRSIGYSPVHPSRKSKYIYGRPFILLGNSHEAFTLRSSDGVIADDITSEVDLTRLYNKVTVVGNNTNGDPVSTVIVNNDPSSPTSTVSLGTPTDPYVISYYEENPNIIGAADVRKRAEYLMEQSSSVYTRMNVKCPPIFDWEINDVIKCDIKDEFGDQIASGRWRWEKFHMDLSLDGDYEWELFKLIHWEQVDV